MLENWPFKVYFGFSAKGGSALGTTIFVLRVSNYLDFIGMKYQVPFLICLISRMS
jgi:hypothetical protein